MTPAQPPAPRTFERAAALYVAQETDFPSHWRRDSTLQTWRHHEPDTGHWRPLLGDLAPLAHEVTERLEAALAAELPPLAFRAVAAPVHDTKVRREATVVSEWQPGDHDRTDTIHGDYLDPVLTADDLATSTSWADARDRLATKYVERFQRRARDGAHRDYERGHTAPLIGPEQRDRLLKAASSSATAVKVLVALSGLPECLYARPAAPVEIDARDWIERHLIPAPGVDVGMRWAREQYVAAVAQRAPGVKPLDAKKFRALVQEAGIDVEHTRDGKAARGVRLVDDQGRDVSPSGAVDPAPLRLVATDSA